VLNIAGDVDALELTVSQMSASTLPYDANISTKQKIDNVESNIPTSASDLPYSSTQSTKQKIDSIVTKQTPTQITPTPNDTYIVTTSNYGVSVYRTGNIVTVSITEMKLKTGLNGQEILLSGLPEAVCDNTITFNKDFRCRVVINNGNLRAWFPDTSIAVAGFSFFGTFSYVCKD
jgi:hypothetical protein